LKKPPPPSCIDQGRSHMFGRARSFTPLKRAAPPSYHFKTGFGEQTKIEFFSKWASSSNPILELDLFSHKPGHFGPRQPLRQRFRLYNIFHPPRKGAYLFAFCGPPNDVICYRFTLRNNALASHSTQSPGPRLDTNAHFLSRRPKREVIRTVLPPGLRYSAKHSCPKAHSGLWPSRPVVTPKDAYNRDPVGRRA